MSEDKEQKTPESSFEQKAETKITENIVENTVEQNEVPIETTPEESTEEIVEAKVETDVLEEIDDSNAEDAEDTDTVKRHDIPMPDYHEMSMENLVGELQRLVKNEKVQAIRKHVDTIKDEFNQKFDEFLEEKKEEFTSNGGNEIDNSTKYIMNIAINEINITKA